MIERKAIYGLGENYLDKFITEDWDFAGKNTQKHLHSLHPYPARFIPQIPEKAIKEWTQKGEVVMDPFCGGGTTLLESIILGRPAIGIDNNSVATLVSKSKVAAYSNGNLKIITDFYENFDNLIKQTNEISKPSYKNFEYWFSEEAIQDLGKIKSCIRKLPALEQQFCYAVFSAIIVRVSRQDSDTRYARIDRFYTKGSAIEAFKRKLKSSISGLKEIIKVPKEHASVYLGDGRNLSFVPNSDVKLIVTSPPYINAYDYHKYHRHRLHWTDGDVELARDVEIGKHDTFTRKNATPDRYFEDMKACFSEWKRFLTEDGKAFIVVGDGIVNGKPVPVGDTFIEILQDVGFVLKSRWIRKIPRNKKSFNREARLDLEHLLLVENKR